MTNETQEWLDENIIMGYTHPDYGLGDAWHRKVSNHNSYPAAVPIEAAERFFDWAPIGVRPHFIDGTPITDHKGKSPMMVVCSDTLDLLGVFAEVPSHGYTERLLRFTESIVGGELNIGSLGALDGRKKAFVQIQSGHITTHVATGEKYYPYITAYSSLDATLPTSYKEGIIRVECDNTFDGMLFEKGAKYSFKNTKKSKPDIPTAQDALGIMENSATAFESELDRLVATEVNNAEWNMLTTMIFEGDSTRTHNMRAKLTDVYENDPMVSAFKGTAWGAFQAVNTYQRYYARVNGDNLLVERGLIDTLNGQSLAKDVRTLQLIESL